MQTEHDKEHNKEMINQLAKLCKEDDIKVIGFEVKIKGLVGKDTIIIRPQKDDYDRI